jgi:hypothetical protein
MPVLDVPGTALYYDSGGDADIRQLDRRPKRSGFIGIARRMSERSLRWFGQQVNSANIPEF